MHRAGVRVDLVASARPQFETLYQGSVLDVDASIVSLLRKYSNVCPMVPVHGNIDDDDDDDDGGGNRSGAGSYCSVVWLRNATSGEWSFSPCKDFLDVFRRCASGGNVRFVCGNVDLIIAPSTIVHANAFVYDKRDDAVELFEPAGAMHRLHNERYNTMAMYAAFRAYFLHTVGVGRVYILPEACPTVGFQYSECLERTQKAVERTYGEVAGFCAAWSAWWVEYRVCNADARASRAELMHEASDALVHEARTGAGGFASFIRNYAQSIVDARNGMLREAIAMPTGGVDGDECEVARALQRYDAASADRAEAASRGHAIGNTQWFHSAGLLEAALRTFMSRILRHEMARFVWPTTEDEAAASTALTAVSAETSRRPLVTHAEARQALSDVRLFEATVRGDTAAVHAAVVCGGANPNATRRERMTPLHYAAGYGHTGVVATMLRAGADVHARDIAGWTPLHYAAQGAHAHVARTLVDHGADVHAATAREGHTPKDIALRNGTQWWHSIVHEQRTRTPP